MDTRASFQVGELTLSLEGSEDFVSLQIERFADLIVRHAGRPGRQSPDAGARPDAVSDEAEGAPPAKARRGRAAGGSGSGCTAKVRALLVDGFFKSTRTTKMVVDKLREQATPYPSNKVSAALVNLARGKHLRRFAEGGDWVYIVP